MAHGLEKDDAMFVVREPAWHGLGTVLENHPTTAEDALKEAGLDWDVALQETYHLNTDDGLFYESGKEFKSVVRLSDRKTLGVVGTKYRPVQNRDAFSFFDTAAGEGLAEYHTAGSLKGGKIVWILAKLEGLIEILPKDFVEQYLLLYHSHDGLMSVRIGLTPVRVVCMNTLGWAASAMEAGHGAISRIKHTSSAENELAELAGAIAQAKAVFQDAAGQWRFLASAKIGAAQLSEYIQSVYPFPVPGDDGVVPPDKMKHVRERIKELHESGAGSDLKGVRGTVYGAYNALVEYIDHERGRSQEVRLRSQWWGEGSKKKAEAFDSAMELATNIVGN